MPLLFPLFALPFFLFILALGYVRDPPVDAKPFVWAMLVLSLPGLASSCLTVFGPLLGPSFFANEFGSTLRRIGLNSTVAGLLIFVVIRTRSQQDWRKETLAVLLSAWILCLMLILAMGP